MPSEWVLWLLAAAAGGAAWLAGRTGAQGLSRPAGWGSFALFTLGAGFWMFGDTYAYYYAGKESALRFAYWGSYREHQMWGEIIQAFRRRHPEISVKREYITDRYSEKIQQLLLADEAPDVLMFQDEPFPRFVSSGKFEALDDYCRQPDRPLDLDSDFFETSVPHFQVDGRTYGIPVFGGNCLILYNRDCLSRGRGCRSRRTTGRWTSSSPPAGASRRTPTATAAWTATPSWSPPGSTGCPSTSPTAAATSTRPGATGGCGAPRPRPPSPSGRTCATATTWRPTGTSWGRPAAWPS